MKLILSVLILVLSFGCDMTPMPGPEFAVSMVSSLDNCYLEPGFEIDGGMRFYDWFLIDFGATFRGRSYEGLEVSYQQYRFTACFDVFDYNDRLTGRVACGWMNASWAQDNLFFLREVDGPVLDFLVLYDCQWTVYRLGVRFEWPSTYSMAIHWMIGAGIEY